MIMVVQYLLAIGIILGSLWVIGHYEPLHPNAYIDMWRSFTIIYILGAICCYVGLYIDIRKKNRWLEEAKKRVSTIENTKENDLE